MPFVKALSEAAMNPKRFARSRYTKFRTQKAIRSVTDYLAGVFVAVFMALAKLTGNVMPMRDRVQKVAVE